jgi:hypothetical protein
MHPGTQIPTVKIFMPKTLELSPGPDPKKDYFDPDPTLPENVDQILISHIV